MDRREFLQSSGSLVILLGLPACEEEERPAIGGNLAIANRISLDSSGKVILAPGKVELGQGIMTAFAQIAAEELHVDIGRISVTAVDTASSPDEFYTFSSISVQKSGPLVRQAAASGYQHLLQQAAARLGVDHSKLTANDGEILQDGRPTGLSFWQLLEGNQQTITPTAKAITTSPADYKIVGQSIERLDIPGKVFGRVSFLQDIRLPNMVHARVVHPPSPGSAIESINKHSVTALPGVLKLVRDGNFVAVIAEREQQARNAARQLAKAISWTATESLAGDSGIYDWLKSSPSTPEIIASTNTSAGNTDTRLVSATFQRPYQCHASISPSAAVAVYNDGELTVWSHAQGMYPLRAAIAHTLGLSEDKVRCIHREASGCYGHNGADDAACEAAAIATHLAGRPVRLQWERGDEFLCEPYGSAMQVEVSAALSASGKITRWEYDIWSCTHSGRPRNAVDAGNLLYAQLKENPLPLPVPRAVPQPNGGADRNGIPLYDFATVQVTKHLMNSSPLRTSALRGLGAYTNVFAIESFMDQLAEQAGQDPLAFRLQHLSNQRAINVLQKLSAVSDWANRPESGTGRGWGIGFAQFKNISSYLGLAMQLEVDQDTSVIRLHKATAVCDAGLVINPDGLRAQIEGGIVQSASWTLKEKLRFDTTSVQTSDWLDYPILRFDEVPEIEVILINTNAEQALGVGETAQGPTAAAIANAVYHASGQRLRQLPLTLRKRPLSKLISQSLA